MSDATAAQPAASEPQVVINPRPREDAPVRKLTTGLLKTYKSINERYYEAKKARAAAKAGAPKAEDYVVQVGDMLGTHYKVEESMGKGSFGQVVAATDTRTGVRVAVKVIKNKDAFRRQARTEIKLLELLNRKDLSDECCIVRFFESFDHNGHTCLVFEHLSFNLYELLRKTQFRGVSLTLIRKFARQILRALAFLAKPEVDVIHCDLKPENILFRYHNRSAIKVIDFGSSCTSDKRMYKYIQSRFYRSPEVVLELPYSQAIDMWSLGCILVEMHTGVPLFSGKDEADQMRRFVSLKGLPPPHMLAASRKTPSFFEVHPAPPLPASLPVIGTPPPPVLARLGSSSSSGLAAASGTDVSASAGEGDVSMSPRQADATAGGAGAGAGTSARYRGYASAGSSGGGGGGGATERPARRRRGGGPVPSVSGSLASASLYSGAGGRMDVDGTASSSAGGLTDGGSDSDSGSDSEGFRVARGTRRQRQVVRTASYSSERGGEAGTDEDDGDGHGEEKEGDDDDDDDDDDDASSYSTDSGSSGESSHAGHSGAASVTEAEDSAARSRSRIPRGWTPEQPAPFSAAASLAAVASASSRSEGMPVDDASTAAVDDASTVASPAQGAAASASATATAGGSRGPSPPRHHAGTRRPRGPSTAYSTHAPSVVPSETPDAGAAAAGSGGAGFGAVPPLGPSGQAIVARRRLRRRMGAGGPDESDDAAVSARTGGGWLPAAGDAEEESRRAARRRSRRRHRGGEAVEALDEAPAFPFDPSPPQPHPAPSAAVQQAGGAALAAGTKSSAAVGESALPADPLTSVPLASSGPYIYRLKPVLAAGTQPAEKEGAGSGSGSAPAHREPPVYTDLREVLGVHTFGPSGRRRGEKCGHTPAHYAQLLDLVERMLEYDPARRIKPLAALQHPFLRDVEEPQSEGSAPAPSS